MAICLAFPELIPCTALYSRPITPNASSIKMPDLVRSLVYFYQTCSCFNRLKVCFTPSQPTWLLAHVGSIKLYADGQLSFLLHTVTGFHWLSFSHYYGFICHLTPTHFLNHFLSMSFRFLFPELMPGFPSYYTDSLSEITPPTTSSV